MVVKNLLVDIMNNRSVGVAIVAVLVASGAVDLWAGEYDGLRKAEIVVDTLDNFFIKDVGDLMLDRVEAFVSVEDDSPWVGVIENGLRHRNGVIDGCIYQERYGEGDNIRLSGYDFKIKEVDALGSKVIIGENNVLVDIAYQPKGFNHARYYGGKEYLFIYEWMPGDAESAGALSYVKELYRRYRKWVSFLGVGYVDKNDKAVAKRLWKQLNPGFKTIFIDDLVPNKDFPAFVITDKSWLTLEVAGMEYFPVVEETLEGIKERLEDDDQ